ncbi:methyl-accepting chemotaxis protein [Thalassospira alkalitolerans]|uniref:methyl-accepting chemotaxis protein n=1 Tax=Thalassospira alkalitolerans TaxID=1293890 RepID=UPI003AA9E258
MGFASIFKNNSAQDGQQIYNALSLSMAVIEFAMDGKILTANDNFLKTMGYKLEEVVGKNHSLFVPKEISSSDDYRRFWDQLRAGKFSAGAVPRVKKNGEMIWLEATYNPIMGADGKPTKVVKFATDITERRVERALLQSVFSAIEKSQAVIEFDLKGNILKANNNFLDVMGYSENEIVGKHHSMFVEKGQRDTEEYRSFWQKLNAGEFQAGQFKRLGKGGREVWIEASYNPVLDPVGKPFKVIKFAIDITEQTNLLLNLKAMIDKNFSEIDSNISALDRSANQSVSASEETLRAVQTVAASAEEMAASIAEISRSMTQSRTETERAFDQTVSANSSTQRMTEVVESMGSIVEVIQNIAGQINLLALNATIESARAGDAGKGFAVVANEVKNLANQAARATEQISAEISGIQSISSEVVEALGTIRHSVETVRDSVTNISSAVEEQSAVTEGVSENMRMMASAVDGLSQNLDSIKSTTGMVADSVSRTREAAEVLAR